MSIVRSRSLFFCLTVLFVAAAAAAGSGGGEGSSGGSFCGLGDLPGGIFYSEANAVSADGKVVVGASRSSGGTEAFMWSAPVGIRGLQDLSGGGIYSRAWAISANGRVIVGESASSNGEEAFAWISGAGMVGIGDLDGDPFESSAGAVSQDGSTIVGTALPDDGVDTAFRWHPGGGLVRLTEDEDIIMSEANGVSNDGTVVVGLALIDSAVEAFRWTAASGLVGIGDLPGGNAFSQAHAVSADGSTVVGESASDLGTEAFAWTARTGMTGLGAFPAEHFSSRALAVSADGAVIVGTSFTDEGGRAFIWDAVSGMRNLALVIQSETDADLAGWTLEEATGVSADGSVIVGNGINPAGRFEGWIAKLACAPGVLAGRADTGNGSPPFPVFTINGSFGGACREVSVTAGVPVNVEISNPPSVAGEGHYALWIYDGAPTPGVSAEIRLQTFGGELFNLGLGPQCLPVNNTEAAGACPCPLTFPVGRTSKGLNGGKAALLCLTAASASPRSPTIFTQTFPPGDFLLGGVVLDRNSVHSPRKNVSIGNWIVVRSR